MQAIFGFALSGGYNKLVHESSSIAGFAVLYGIFLAFGVSFLTHAFVHIADLAGSWSRK
jgi:hypothetical protein